MKSSSAGVQSQTEKTTGGGRRPMRETILLSFFLGLLAPAAFILGAEPFAVRGRNSIKEIVGGCVAVALYLAICQFWVAPKGSRGLGTKWATLVAMSAPLVIVVIVIALGENPHAALVQGLPMLISACCGALAGALLAGRIKRPAHATPTQR